MEPTREANYPLPLFSPHPAISDLKVIIELYYERKN
jgi:hypothetical protein